MKLRIDELAARSGATVDTIRFYQAEGLLPKPSREGRVAWYDDAHLERLRRIAALKEQGLTLAAIRRLLEGDFAPADELLIEAVASSATGRSRPGGALTLDELARRTGVSAPLLKALEREHLIESSGADGEGVYSEADAIAVTRCLELLEAGLPLSELLALAREHDAVMKEIARRAVELFIRFVRDPAIAESSTDEDAAARVVDAFRRMLPATTELVATHFERVLLREALARVQEDATGAEKAAVEEQRRQMRG